MVGAAIRAEQDVAKVLPGGNCRCGCCKAGSARAKALSDKRQLW